MPKLKTGAATYATLTQAATVLGIDRAAARRKLARGEFIIQNYEGRIETAAAFGVSVTAVKHYLRTGKLRFERIGTSIVVPVGQHGEQLRKGWPDLPRKKYLGPCMGKDVIIPQRTRGRKPKATT